MPDRYRKLTNAVIQEHLPLPVHSDINFDIQFLTQPSLFLVGMANAKDAPFVVYTRDAQGRFLYLSPSAQRISDRSPSELMTASLLEFLSDASCNQRIKNLWTSDSPEEHNSLYVEIVGRTGTLIRIEMTETALVSENRTIGYAGFMKRSEHTEACLTSELQLSDQELVQRAKSLSAVERQVAELVVDGHMNKRMASLLHVAVRTIETRRARVMSKMRAKSLPQLVQMWLRVRQIEAETKISGN